MRAFLGIFLLLAAVATGQPIPLRVRCLPPDPEVTLIASDGRRLPLQNGVDRAVWKGKVTLELASPGYKPYRVQLEAAPTRAIELPPERDRFYRLEPIHARLTFLSRPPGAAVWFVKGRHRELLGKTGEPLSFDLSTVAQAKQGRFDLSLPAYHDEPVILPLQELEKNPQVGPVSLRPAFPGAAVVSWLALRPAVTWVLLVLLLVGMVAVAVKLRNPRSR